LNVDDDAFLDRMLAGSAGCLCRHQKEDLRRLIGLAGFGPETLIWQDVAGASGPLEVRGEAIRQLVEMVREEKGE